MNERRSGVMACMFAGMLLFPATAAAQEQARLNQARTFFEEGLEAASEERWHEARAAFERALDLAERPSILLNLAGAQMHTGLYVEAVATYERYLQVATSSRDRTQRTEAQQALRLARGQIAHLHVEAPGARSSDSLRVDGREVERGAGPYDLSLNPGRHTIVSARDGVELARTRVQLTEGDRQRINLTLAAAPLSSAASGTGRSDVGLRNGANDDEGLPDDAQDGGDDAVVIGVVIAAVVVVAAGAVITVALLADGGSGPDLHMGDLGDGQIRF